MLGLILLGQGGPHGALCADYYERFDGQRASWKVQYEKPNVLRLSRRRNKHTYHSGIACETISIDAGLQGATVQLEHPLPRSRVFDDLNLSVWVKSNHNGAQLALRIIFPHQKDPRTGQILSTLVRGSRYTNAPEWQRLVCTTLTHQVQERLRFLRARNKPVAINSKHMYVDQAVIMAQLGPGKSKFFLDDLKLGPVISPSIETPIVQLSADQNDMRPQVEFRLDRLLIDGCPTLPRMTPFHGEDPEHFKKSGLNLVWIPDYSNQELIDDLRSRGLWAMTPPPRAVSDSGHLLDATQASLIPFTTETAGVLAWSLGTRITPSAQKELIAWIGQIRSADRRLNRPLMADVTGLEHVYSRHVDLLGISRHVINTSFPLKQYRDWLSPERRLTRPGSFVWTWIQTEPAVAHSRWRHAANKTPMVIEPEQIQLQVYAALAAGCRGIAYWKTTALDDNAPGARERELMITQLNLELELIEPWLATGTLVEQIPFEVGHSDSQRSAQSRGTIRTGTLFHRKPNIFRNNQLSRESQRHDECEAAVLETDYGLLLLLVWYQEGAQFVPGKMVARDATIVIPGVPATASAWNVTTTKIESLNSDRVAGGIKITLPNFDQTAAIVLTSDRNLISMLQNKMEQMQVKSARVSIDLALQKLERVRRVNEEFKDLGVEQPDAPQLLASAEAFLQRAENVYRRAITIQQQPNVFDQGKDFAQAQQLSDTAMQALRILQRAYWDEARRSLSLPVSSLHTVCFQTLPDHWRMIEHIGRSTVKSERNELPSGDFENIDTTTMVRNGWRYDQNTIDGIRANAELALVSRHGDYCLRLVAVPTTNDEPSNIVRRNQVSVTTPSVRVQSGQILHVSGWARVISPITANLDGAMLFDNLTGPIGAIRWNEKCDWHQFQLIREIHQNGEFKITIALHGLGEIQFDDLRIIAHTPRQSFDATQSAVRMYQEKHKATHSEAFDIFQRLPRLNPLRPER